MQATSPTTLASRRPTTDLWSLSGGKRLFDLTCALMVVVLASPIMIVLALAVKASSRGPCLFRQNRVGKNGDEVLVLKFRTMHSNHGNNSGPLITRAGDRRVTSVGKWLRKWKLDELPQILNVLRGDMSFVGYRPDMLKYMQTLIGQDRNILYFRPGITSPASLKFRNEEQELAKVPAGEMEQFYVRNLLPQKIRIDLDYSERATFLTDCRILLRTAFSVLWCQRG